MKLYKLLFSALVLTQLASCGSDGDAPSQASINQAIKQAEETSKKSTEDFNENYNRPPLGKCEDGNYSYSQAVLFSKDEKGREIMLQVFFKPNGFARIYVSEYDEEGKNASSRLLKKSYKYTIVNDKQLSIEGIGAAEYEKKFTSEGKDTYTISLNIKDDLYRKLELKTIYAAYGTFSGSQYKKIFKEPTEDDIELCNYIKNIFDEVIAEETEANTKK